MDKLAEMFAAVATKYGPQVTDAALGAVRVEAYSNMVQGGISLAVAGVFGYATYCFLRASNNIDTNTDINDTGMFLFIGGIITAAITLVSGLCGLWTFIDPWTWTALYHPELWLAKQALKIG